MVKPIDRWVRKYEERASVATDDYKFGVLNPKRKPASAAIQNRKALESKMQMKETWDKWEDGLRFVGDEGVMNAAATKGADRYVPGIKAGVEKVQDFAAKFSKHLEEGQRKVWSIPKVSLQDSIKRASTMIEHNARFRYKKK